MLISDLCKTRKSSGFLTSKNHIDGLAQCCSISSVWKTRAFLSCIVDYMVADGLVLQAGHAISCQGIDPVILEYSCVCATKVKKYIYRFTHEILIPMSSLFLNTHPHLWVSSSVLVRQEPSLFFTKTFEFDYSSVCIGLCPTFHFACQIYMDGPWVAIHADMEVEMIEMPWLDWLVLIFGGTPGMGLLTFHSLISQFLTLRKHMLHSSNHVHIWQVSLQLSCNDTY